jgi:hypothetical protein
MSNALSVRVASRKTEAGEYYEGTVSIAGLKPTKLARRSDGSTQFPTKSAVSGAARNLAKSLGFADVDVNDTTVVKAAAKVKTTKSKAPATLSVNSTAVTTQTQKKAVKKSASSTNQS